MSSYEDRFVKLRVVFHSLYFENEVGDPQFFCISDMCKMGMTGLHDSHARVLAVLITLLSRVYLLGTVLSYMILMTVP